MLGFNIAASSTKPVILHKNFMRSFAYVLKRTLSESPLQYIRSFNRHSLQGHML